MVMSLLTPLFGLGVCAAGYHGKMENRPVGSPYHERTMVHMRGYKNHGAFGNQEFFIFQPELDFPIQLVRIFIVVTEETDYFGNIMFMLFALVSCWVKIPGTVHLEGARHYIVIHPQDTLRIFL
jgi:hypothetical protein